MRQVVSRDFVKYHLREALRASVAEADDDEDLARRLRAAVKLRLINMSDEELWELAKQTSSPECPVELAYKRHKQTAEELRAASGE